MRIAFKEWAIVVDALARGDQLLIFRKGGIAEGRTGFSVEHPEFLLFPTLFHQQRECVIPEAQHRYDEIAPNFPAPGVLRMEHWGRVAAWKQLTSVGQALRFKGQHIWRDEVIAERFAWGKAQNIFVFAVRVFRLPQAVELPMEESYGGCKSWVELERNIAMEGSKPVLGDQSFAQKMSGFNAALIDGTQNSGDFSTEPLPKP